MNQLLVPVLLLLFLMSPGAAVPATQGVGTLHLTLFHLPISAALPLLLAEPALVLIHHTFWMCPLMTPGMTALLLAAISPNVMLLRLPQTTCVICTESSHQTPSLHTQLTLYTTWFATALRFPLGTWTHVCTVVMGVLVGLRPTRVCLLATVLRTHTSRTKTTPIKCCTMSHIRVQTVTFFVTLFGLQLLVALLMLISGALQTSIRLEETVSVCKITTFGQHSTLHSPTMCLQ